MIDTHLSEQRISQKQEIKESLSALADGEASDLEVRRILAACDKDPELRQSWSRYQILSQVLKNDCPDTSVDLSTRIKTAIANQPLLDMKEITGKGSAGEKSTRKRGVGQLSATVKARWSGVGRFAIAASVAAAVVLGVQYTPVDQSAGTVASAPASSTSSEQIVYGRLANKNIVQAASHLPNDHKPSIQSDKQPITISASDLEKVKNNKDDLQKRLNRLMLEHVENVSHNNYQGILPYARVPSVEQ